MVGVWRFENAPPSASDGAGEMRAQVGAAGTHPGIQTSEGGSVEIAGADDAYSIDISSGDGEANSQGRWWILVDDDSTVAAVVEFVGLDVGEDELEVFADSLEFDSGQGW